MKKVWKAKNVSRVVKLRLYLAGVISVLVYGCEAWRMTENALKALRGWNAKCLIQFTERERVEECRSPSIDLLGFIEKRRVVWLGKILRASETSLLRQVVLAQCESWIGSYPIGSLFESAPKHDTIEELIEMARDEKFWKKYSNCLYKKTRK